jgi:hypothetical protein
VTAGSGVIVVDWNKELVRIVSTPGAQPATVHPACSFAIMHAAIYDAVVSITHRGTPYLLLLNAPTGVRPDAAAAEAGRDHDRIRVTSDVLPGVVRTFDSYNAAATEAGLSRIYGGVHTRIDHQSGLQLGRDVGGFVLHEAGSPEFGFTGSKA